MLFSTALDWKVVTPIKDEWYSAAEASSVKPSISCGLARTLERVRLGCGEGYPTCDYTSTSTKRVKGLK